MLIAAASIQAQSDRANNWAFPYQNGLTFDGNTITTYTTAVPAGSSGTQNTSTISDENGQLLFYSNGEKAWDKTHQVMPNGSALNGDQFTTQTSIIIPDPLLSSRYFLFTLDNSAQGNGLDYYIVDMSFNGGLGDVVSPAFSLADTVTEKLCAVKHANDYAYWVVAHKWGSNEFLAFLVDSFGVNPNPVISAVGTPHSGAINGVIGQMKISPDGTRLALASWAKGLVELFDFDAETGVVSNPITLAHFSTNFPVGIEFSNDSRKLYYTQRPGANGKLFQFDLEHLHPDCLIDSKVELFDFGGLKLPSAIQLARNGKLYIGVNYFPSYDTLAVVNEPTLKGSDCGFDEFGFHAPSTVREGLTSIVSSYLSDGIHVVFGTNCDGQPTEFYPEDSLNLDSVYWDFGDPITGILNHSKSVNASHVFSTPDTFTITLIAYRANHTDTFTKNVVVWDTISDILGPDTTICNGQGFTLAVDQLSTACFEWSDGSSGNAIQIDTAGVYWVDVYHQSCLFRDTVAVKGVDAEPIFELGNDTVICLNESFIIDPTAQGPVHYTWHDGSHDTTYLVTAPGTYWLRMSNACGSATDTLHVLLNTASQPILNFPNDTTICDTLPLVIDVTFNDAVYSWNDGSQSPVRQISTPGIYSVTVGNSCDTVSDTLVVQVDSIPTYVAPHNALLCDATDAISIQPSSDSNVIWNWSTGTAANRITISQPGQYWFSMSGACGTLSDTFSVLRYDSTFSISLGSDTVLCNPGQYLEFDLGALPYNFEATWSTGIRGPRAALQTGPNWVILQNKCTTLTDSIYIHGRDSLVIMASAPGALCEGDEKTLFISTDGLSNIFWSNGETSAQITISTAGIYTVSALDSNGCTVSDSISISGHCPLLVNVPNVFTPNADGINDEFCVEALNARHTMVHIFNRWGEMVFAGMDAETCWTGKINGQEAPAGVYFYLVESTSPDGTVKRFRGSLTLVK
ncbi:MAG: hypothetical protein Kow0075_00850 [Salibacteraceae bacterium]